jgi:hypothetical protein
MREQPAKLAESAMWGQPPSAVRLGEALFPAQLSVVVTRTQPGVPSILPSGGCEADYDFRRRANGFSDSFFHNHK